MERLGEVLKSLRTANGLTQFDVAVQSGVGLATYQKTEQGNITPGSIKLETLRKLGKLYNMKPSDILKACGE